MTADRRVRLRFATPDDAASLIAISGPLVLTTPITFGDAPTTEAELSKRIADALERWPFLVACVDGAVLGYTFGRAAGPTAGERWTVEVGIALAEAARGKQLGTRLYTALFRMLEAQGYRTLVAYITLPNPASVALHERFGFQSAGVLERAGYKLGAWHSVSRWQKHFGALSQAPGTLATVRDVSHLLEDA